MTSRKLKAMILAQKKAKMKPVHRQAKMSTERKVVYVPIDRAIITKSKQEESAAA